jgi:mono/diheme cytochrome c family protein
MIGFKFWTSSGRWAVLVMLIVASSACDEVMPKRSAGEKLFRKHCAECHGYDAEGQTVRYMGNNYANLRDDMWRHYGDARGMEQTIRDGLVFLHPTYGKLTDQEIRQITDHIFKLRGERRR